MHVIVSPDSDNVISRVSRRQFGAIFHTQDRKFAKHPGPIFPLSDSLLLHANTRGTVSAAYCAFAVQFQRAGKHEEHQEMHQVPRD